MMIVPLEASVISQATQSPEMLLAEKAFAVDPTTVYGLLNVVLFVIIFFLYKQLKSLMDESKASSREMNEKLISIIENNSKVISDNTKALKDIESAVEETNSNTINAFKSIVDSRVIELFKEYNIMKR